MKHSYSTTILFVILQYVTPCFSQVRYTTAKEVYDAKEIIFYGYDFSDAQVADTKRMGQDLKSYFFSLSSYLQDHLSEDKLANWIEKDKVTFNLIPTFNVNKTIHNENIVTAGEHHISKDSLQIMVNKYVIPEQSGIGCVFIFECFNSYTKTASAYFVFFDNPSKRILWSDYASKHDSNSYNRMRDWNAAAFMVLKQLTNRFLSASGRK